MKRKAYVKVVARKKRKITKFLSNSVKSIVRKSLLNKTETKSILSYTTRQMTDRMLVFSNPLYPIALGDQRNQREGQQIYLKGISVKTNLQATLVNNATLHMAVVMSNVKGNGFLNSTVTVGNFFRNNTSHSDLWRLDTNRCTILKTASMKLTNITKTQNNENQKHNSIYVNLKNKRVTYNEDDTYFKDKQIYVLYWTSIATGGLQVIDVQSDIVVYFKD